jgi:hypothetical protein
MTPPEFSSRQPAVPDDEHVTYFAVTDTRNKRTPFGIKKEDRSRHSYIIGKTGMGKSTLLENMAIQDIRNGEGVCFIDPHGGTAEKLLQYVPEERVKDILYFAPFDMQYPVSFNVLENVGADKRHFVIAGLMSTFEKIWVDTWSARMAYILQNTLAALLEYPGATLLGVNRMYIDKEYRKNVIAHISDPSIRSFWVDEYSKYTDRYTQEATPAIQNKIGQFASNALVRNIIGQEQSAFDIRTLMDNRKIFIVNLSKGRVGEGNANLLGSMLITKIYLAAMSRADVPESQARLLPPFYLYVDEFQNFANRSFADILSEARKYKLALTIAHQYIEQMEEEVRAAVFGNVGTMMAFRVGSYDAEILEKEFAPIFTADDLVNLGARQIYLKLMIDGVSSQPFSAVTMPRIEEPEVDHRDRAVAYSRAQFSRPRAEVEEDISAWLGKKFEDPDADTKERARTERRAERAGAPALTPRPTSSTSQRNRNGGPSNRAVSGNGTRTLSDAPRHPTRPQEVTPPPPNPKPLAQHEGLRDILAKLTAETKPVRPPTGDPPQTQKVQAPAPPPAAPKPVASPPPVRHDDGKGVTQEDKGELRNLLERLTQQGSPPKPEATNIPGVASTPKPTQPAPLQKRTALDTAVTAPPALKGTERVAPHEPKNTQPPEVPKKELEAILRVERPNLS